MDSLLMDYYNVPRVCEECGGVMVFRGVGEYHCEKCDHVEYDDYGKVRLYLEHHRGATAAEVEEKTGVPQRTIRKLLKEDRLEVADGSKVFLLCEICGKTIKSGRFCKECETKFHRRIEEEQRKKLLTGMKGYGMQHSGEEGQKRFIRDKDN